MPRSLSITRRRPGLIDCSLPARAGVASYNFQWAANFDGAYATFQNVPATGIMAPKVQSVIDVGFTDSQFRGRTRFVFSPNLDYGIPDTKQIWLRIQQVGVDGTLGAFEAGQLVLPYESTPNRTVIIAGTAPSATSISGSLEIQLPQQLYNPIIQNNAVGTNLFIAWEAGGPEFDVPPVLTSAIDFFQTYAITHQLFVRGGGATAAFSAVFALRNNLAG